MLPGEGNGTPLQYSYLENPMDGGAWKAAVHQVTEGRTRLSNFPFTFHFHAQEKEMATHSSVLAWRIPGTGEPGGPPSMGSHRVGHDWSDLAAAAAAAADFVLVYDRNSQLARIITNRGLAQLSCLKLCKTFVIISLFICKGYVDNWYRKAECVLYS